MTRPTRYRVQRTVSAALICLSMAAAPGMLRAQEAFGCIDELSDAQVSARTRAIAEQFRQHERHTRVFRFGWTSIFAGFALLEFTVIGPRAHGAQRWNAYISGVGASSAMLQMAALPMPGVWGRRRIERMPDGTPDERRAQLRYALRTLELAAKSNNIIHGPLSHSSAIVWGLGWGTLLTVKFHNPLVSSQAFLGGVLVNELRILTAPNWASRAWDEARGGFCWDRYVEDGAREPYWDEPQLEAQLLPSLGGLSLLLTF